MSVTVRQRHAMQLDQGRKPGTLLGPRASSRRSSAYWRFDEGLLPGSAHTETVDPAFRSRYQLASEPARTDTVLSNSFGFGGSNCSLIFGRER